MIKNLDWFLSLNESQWIWDLVLWHINHCRLFNAESVLYIYILDIYLVWLGFIAYQPL